MKTAEEIYEENGCNKHSEIIQAMKEYANQKLDEAAEKAAVDRHYQQGGNILWDASVNKQSILSLKDQI